MNFIIKYSSEYDLAIMHLIESEILLEKEINSDLKNNETDPLNIVQNMKIYLILMIIMYLFVQ